LLAALSGTALPRTALARLLTAALTSAKHAGDRAASLEGLPHHLLLVDLPVEFRLSLFRRRREVGVDPRPHRRAENRASLPLNLGPEMRRERVRDSRRGGAENLKRRRLAAAAAGQQAE
jgi:hypothetical protein